jgi:hypothetical protein
MTSLKKNNDNDVFRKVIDIGLRMYGNGYAYPTCQVDYITEYCRQQLRNHFIKHNQLISDSNRLSLLGTIIYISRHKKARLKRLQQFIQAKDRQEEGSVDDIAKNKKMTIINRFIRICRQIQIDINHNKVNKSSLIKNVEDTSTDSKKNMYNMRSTEFRRKKRADFKPETVIG